MDELDLDNMYFIKKGDSYLLCCDDCGDQKVIQEDLEDVLNNWLHTQNTFSEIAIIAEELSSRLQALLPLNKKSSDVYQNKIQRLNILLSIIKKMP
jgi:hypothetical protein